MFITSVASAQLSDEEAARLRRERKPKKNLAQKILTVPTKVIRLPFFILGRGIKHTALFIGDINLIPRTKMLLTSDDELIALYPTGSLGGRAGLGGELRFFDKRFLKRGNKLSLQGAFSVNGHQNHYIRYQIPEMVGPLFLDMRGRYQVKTNEDYFGPDGNESERDGRTNFLHEKAGGELTVGAAWTDWFRTQFTVDYTDHAIEDGDGAYDSTLKVYDLPTTPGLDGAALLGLGGTIALDTRDNDFYPSRGGLVEFSATMFDQVGESDYGFMRYTLELSNYVTLFRPGRIIVARLLGEINTRLSDDKDTPFFERASLGDANSLRGYSTGRFRDKDLILLNLEYRYTIWDKELKGYGALDAVLFMGLGRVFNDLAKDTFKDYKLSYGGGIRSRTMENLLFRAEIARSSEETNIIFAFEPIF